MWWQSGGIMQPNGLGGLAQMGRINRGSGNPLYGGAMQQPLGGQQTISKPMGQMGTFGPPAGQNGLIQQPFSQGGMNAPMMDPMQRPQQQKQQGMNAPMGFPGISMQKPQFGGGL